MQLEVLRSQAPLVWLSMDGCSPWRRRFSVRLASLGIPSPGLDTPYTVQSEAVRPRNDFDSSALACDALAGRDISVAEHSALAAPAAQGPAVTGGGTVFNLHPERLALWAWPLSG